MIQTPVGFRCPECAHEKTRVVSGPAAISGTGTYPATLVLIGVNVAAFLLTIATGSGGFSTASGPIIGDFGLIGQNVADGEWYRLVTGGFLHAGVMHLAFNMFALYFLGKILEPSVGTVRFVMTISPASWPDPSGRYCCPGVTWSRSVHPARSSESSARSS